MGVPVKSLAPTLEPIDLPNGRTDLPVREFTWHMKQLADRAEQGDESAERALLHECVPSITDAEIDALSGGEKLWIVLYCGGRLQEVTAYLKNGGAAAATAGTSPSAPTTSASTPSPASPAPSARTGSRKRNGPSGRRSTLSIG